MRHREHRIAALSHRPRPLPPRRTARRSSVKVPTRHVERADEDLHELQRTCLRRQVAHATRRRRGPRPH